MTGFLLLSKLKTMDFKKLFGDMEDLINSQKKAEEDHAKRLNASREDLERFEAVFRRWGDIEGRYSRSKVGSIVNDVWHALARTAYIGVYDDDLNDAICKAYKDLKVLKKSKRRYKYLSDVELELAKLQLELT